MAATFLQSRPRGVYTCARAAADGAILQYQAHLERMVRGFADMFAIDDPEVLEGLRSRVQAELDKSVDNGTLLVLLAYWDREAREARLEKAELPLPVVNPVMEKVIVGGGGPRKMSSVKDSNWIRERKALEKLKVDLGGEELILVNQDENRTLLLEGLITNFFVLLEDNSTVITSPNTKVLSGTMRKNTIDTLRKQGLQVKEEYPVWENRDKWRAAFVTSVTRPCTLIKTLVNASDGSAIELNIECPKLVTLQKALYATVGYSVES